MYPVIGKVKIYEAYIGVPYKTWDNSGGASLSKGCQFVEKSHCIDRWENLYRYTICWISFTSSCIYTDFPWWNHSPPVVFHNHWLILLTISKRNLKNEFPYHCTLNMDWNDESFILENYKSSFRLHTGDRSKWLLISYISHSVWTRRQTEKYLKPS